MALIACLLQFFSASVLAHASLIDAQPSDASVLKTPPGEVVLHFNEPVAPLVFKLVLPDGSVQPLDQTAVIPDGLNIVLPTTNASGTYLLSWRVVSADGHPVGGALTYSVGAPSTGATPITLASTSSPLLATVIWLSRFGLYVSMFFSIGGVVFFAFVARNPDAPSQWISALVALSWLLLPVAVGTHGLDALAAPWRQLGSWSPWTTSLGTTYGLTASLMLAASIAVLLGNLRNTVRPAASLVALCLFGFALASSGHAASAPPTWLARPTVFLHAIAISLWIGSLPPLMQALRTAQGRQALARFSRIIPWVLACLLLTGLMLAVLQLPRLDALWLSDYGKILCVKLALLAALLLVAAGNRYVLTARVENGDEQAMRRMRKLIAVEVLLVLLILAAATTWRFTPPPRVRATATPATSHLHLHTAQAMADVTLIPHNNHQVAAEVFLINGEGAPLTAKEVVLKFSNPQQGLEPLEETMRPGENQTWKTAPFMLPATGHWQLRIDILVSDFDSISLEGEIPPPR